MAKEIQINLGRTGRTRQGHTRLSERRSAARATWFEETSAKIKLCKCGCGGRIKIKLRHYYEGVPEFMRWHGAVKVTGTPTERFWKQVEKSGDCWLWTGGKTARGYGEFRVAGKSLYSHRYSYEIHFGEIPKGFEVCHKCDNPSCVRPEHLFLGSHADNMADMAKKGRNGNAKLTPLLAGMLVRDCLFGMSKRQAARKYGISKTNVKDIMRGRIWSAATGLKKGS